jgi:hypothetical protein
MYRYTFVIQVHPEGISTLENLSTHELIRLDQLAEIGPHLERWLAQLAKDDGAVRQPPQRS